MIQVLPNWNLNNTLPSFFDRDSATLLELASKMHGTMNELIVLYNDFAENINKTIDDFLNEKNSDFETFQISMRQEFQDFIDIIDLKYNGQIQEVYNIVDNAVKTIPTQTQQAITKMVEDGTLSQLIADSVYNEIVDNIQTLRDSITAFSNRLANVETQVKNNEDSIKGLNETVNMHSSSIEILTGRVLSAENANEQQNTKLSEHSTKIANAESELSNHTHMHLKSGNYHVIIQSDGNLVIYENDSTPIWSSNEIKESITVQNNKPTIYYGSEEPTTELGKDGDLYFQYTEDGDVV